MPTGVQRCGGVGGLHRGGDVGPQLALHRQLLQQRAVHAQPTLQTGEQ